MTNLLRIVFFLLAAICAQAAVPFQRLGMSFGGDTNAHTGFDETVYQLELPDTKPEDVEAIKKFYGIERIAVGLTIVDTVTSLYNGAVVAVQVYPTKDKTTGKMNMEGFYIGEQGVWHKARIDGTREILRDDAGNHLSPARTHAFQYAPDSVPCNRLFSQAEKSRATVVPISIRPAVATTTGPPPFFCGAKFPRENG